MLIGFMTVHGQQKCFDSRNSFFKQGLVIRIVVIVLASQLQSFEVFCFVFLDPNFISEDLNSLTKANNFKLEALQCMIPLLTLLQILQLLHLDLVHASELI